MTHPISKLAGAVSLIALIAAPAVADDEKPRKQWTDDAVIDQVNLGDTWSNLDVKVKRVDEAVIGVNTAVSNSITAHREYEDLRINGTQKAGEVSASTYTDVHHAPYISTTTTAQGNSAVTETYAGRNVSRYRQEAVGDVSAMTATSVGTVDSIASTTSAAGNVISSTAEGELVRQSFVQKSDADVSARNMASIDANSYDATFVTTAASNSVAADAWGGDVIVRGGIQHARAGTRVDAESDVFIGDATNVTNATAASGNSLSATAYGGVADVGRQANPVRQSNGANVQSRSNTLVNELTGFANTTSLGVGNSASVYSVGDGDATAWLDQSNSGGVVASSTFDSSLGGGYVITDATAAGNSAHVSSVGPIGTTGHVTAGINQYNTGTVRANSSTWTSTAGAVVGTATAVGNSATVSSTQQGSQRDW